MKIVENMIANRIPIIDGHVHFFDSKKIAEKIMTAFNEKFEIPDGNYGAGTVEDLIATLDKANVDFAVIANFSVAKYLDTVNNFTLKTAKSNPRLIPLVSVHPDLKKPMAAMMDSYKRRGAKGLKLHPMAQEFEPRLRSRILPDGMIQTPNLEDMYPFLSPEELAENMLASEPK